MSEDTKKTKTPPKSDTKAHEPKKLSDPDRHDDVNEGLEEISHGLPDIGQALIGGGGLIEMLKDIIPALGGACHGCEMGETPFDVLDEDDFDDEDPTVQHFKKNNDGLKGVVKIIRLKGNAPADDAVEHIAAIIDELQLVRLAYRQKTMRDVFASIHRARKGDGQAQFDATVAIEALTRDTTNPAERISLAQARQSVLTGKDDHLDAAAFRVREIFANSVPVSNVRIAYTTLNTQDGEAYLLCPKARHQIGYSLPMEVSKCRDQCIDSRTSVDGRTICQYQQWLKVSADSQNALNNRFDVQRHPDNKANLLTLEPGKRENAEHTTADYQNYQVRFDAAGVDTPKLFKSTKVTNETPFEERLHGDNGLAKQVNVKPADRGKLMSNTDRNAAKLTAPVSDSKDKNRPNRIDPNKMEIIEEQIDEAPKEKVPTDVIEKRLEGDGLYTNKGDKNEKRPQDLHRSAAAPRIDPNKMETVEEQLDQVHDKSVWKGNKTIEKVLEEETSSTWTEDDYNEMIEQLLGDSRDDDDED